MFIRNRLHLSMYGVILAATLAVANPLPAVAQESHQFAVETTDAARAIQEFGTQAGLQIFASAEQLAGKRLQEVNGMLSTEEGLRTLLSGTGLTHRYVGERTVALVKEGEAASRADAGGAIHFAESEADQDAQDKALPSVVVQGKRLESKATTGTKTDTPIMETPLNVQVISRQVLEDQQISTLTDALSNISGVVSTHNSLLGGAGEYVTMRGFAGNGPGSNVMTDGVRFDNSTGLTQMANVESVEVLKGPAAILYGRMEPGGVVNVVSKKPLESSLQSLEQQVGSWGVYRTRLDSTGPLTAGANLLYRLNVAYDNVPSWRDGDVYSKTVLIAPSLLWRFGSRTEVVLDLKYNRARAGDDLQVMPWVDGKPGLIPWERNLNEPSPSTNITKTATATLTQQLGGHWSARVKAAHNENTLGALDTFVAYMYSAGGVPPWTASRTLSSWDSTAKADFAGIDLTGHFDTVGIKHTLLIGADRTASSYDLETVGGFTDSNYSGSDIDVLNPVHPGAPFILDPTLPFAAYATDIKTTESGLYLQDQVELPHKIFLTAGVREQKVTTDSVGGYFGFPLDSSRRSESAATPRAGILWGPKSWLSVYASYTESFGASFGYSYPGQPMPPTGAKQYEAGVKSELLDGALHGTLAVFDLTKTNIATADMDPTHLPIGQWLVPVGEARSKGVEFDLQGDIRPNWNAIVTYAYTDAHITRNNSQPFTVGDRLPQVPTNMVSLWTTYSFQERKLHGLKIGGGIRWRDETAVSRLIPGAPQQTPNPTYALVNAMASYGFKVGTQTWLAQLNVSNLLNKKYWDVPQQLFPPYEFAYIGLGDPRSFTASLKVLF